MEHRQSTGFGRLSTQAGLAALLGLCLAGAARAETVNKTAQPGQKRLLQGFSYSSPPPSCRSQAALIELVRPPRGGRIEQRREFAILNATVEDDGSARSKPDGCESVKMDTMSLYYTARPDFSGLDTLSVDVTFSDGTTVPYTFRITVPEGRRREAPAVSQAPAPRDGGSGRPAETAGVAPTGRAATTEDFLRDTVREAAPANRRAPAAEPPKAMVRTEQPASAPNDVPPPRVDAPPAPREMAPARPPAMPQL
ncbi:cadherin-like domain-containing protein [Methylobacterium bullatum]|uniref:Translation initiation factor IF-2 n=1 Tax=Methylobacterium bullatum TaxID=570505 RepID=A0AAV4Z0X0_9HYPH|nr:cadherin-like domain-containing protein [Methylobacterium bullatum]GJD37761.1 hypothetical protein OICFNHDK_0199 [Methylobacterium bullatum]